MNIVVKGRHMDVTDSIRQYVEAKVGKLPRFYDHIQSIEVTIGLEADQPMVEILVQASRRNTFVATHREEDMYACIDQCLHKITEQVRRHKDRVRDRQGPPHNEVMDRQGK